MMLYMLHMTEPSLKLSTVLQLCTSIANNYINICSLATWGNTKVTRKVLLLPFKIYVITLHTLYKVSCQDLSEATMVISDQKL